MFSPLILISNVPTITKLETNRMPCNELETEVVPLKYSASLSFVQIKEPCDSQLGGVSVEHQVSAAYQNPGTRSTILVVLTEEKTIANMLDA